MSLEKAIADLTVALNANTEALKAGGGKPAASSGSSSSSSAGKTASAPTKTRNDVNTILNKVKDEKGAEAAKSIIKDTGGAAKMAEIAEDKFDAVYAAAEKALKPADDDM